MIYLYIFLCSFMFSLFFISLFIKLKGSAKKISCVGGAGIYAAFLIVMLAALFLKEIEASKVLGLIISSGIILVLGLIDDASELRPSLKILGELLGIGVLAAFGIITKIVFLPLWANVLITILWVLFITNAFNLLDIMDGLASGLIIIISLTFLIIAVIDRDFFSALILIALIGAHLGFLKYNYPPAQVYMGDSGSLFSGFLLAALAINIRYAPMDRPMALFTPLLVLSLPIYDTLFLIIMRLKKKKPIFNKSEDHIALRLVNAGCSVRKSVLIMYCFSLFLAVSSLVVAFSSNITAAIMLTVIILVFILMGKRVGIVRVKE
ncbi:MAG: undecaprenyl/decaprenyl-phosphate alpha-N-acetylglucosaminyl 1-phosphate transferase [Candidatus Omnitrophica bacterium]|nr:undecaprenyl/decaprenyl-phosphate alpha-N-acetylglucosaminyl 1-phosphate transferase [Candidatus Omnitrophota bacterium]MBU4590073.1 undecaprenyl/decaprenyl-phosphate alpha-N-acetylglucosaminyl 1-phosphate transferase [Candidatus Omnitrophota bacterium]